MAKQPQTQMQQIPTQQPSSPSSQTSLPSETRIAMQSKFDTLDANHDGYIDKKEAAADKQLASQFASLDANHDMKLSFAEFSNAKGLALNKSEENKDRQQ